MQTREINKMKWPELLSYLGDIAEFGDGIHYAAVSQEIGIRLARGERAVKAVEKLLKIRKEFRKGKSVAFYIGESGEILDEYLKDFEEEKP